MKIGLKVFGVLVFIHNIYFTLVSDMCELSRISMYNLSKPQCYDQKIIIILFFSKSIHI